MLGFEIPRNFFQFNLFEVKKKKTIGLNISDIDNRALVLTKKQLTVDEFNDDTLRRVTLLMNKRKLKLDDLLEKESVKELTESSAEKDKIIDDLANQILEASEKETRSLKVELAEIKKGLSSSEIQKIIKKGESMLKKSQQKATLLLKENGFNSCEYQQ